MTAYKNVAATSRQSPTLATRVLVLWKNIRGIRSAKIYCSTACRDIALYIKTPIRALYY